VCRTIWCLLSWVVGIVLTLTGPAVLAQVQTLRQAEAVVTVGGVSARDTVSLPYHWERRHPGVGGGALFELRFHLDALPTEPHALYLPRLGNAYAIWLNGNLLQRGGDLYQANGADFAKAPRYIEIAPRLLHKDNLLLIQIRADVGRRGGLAPVAVGPAPAVLPLYKRDYAWRITGSSVVAIANLLVALVALSLWFTQVDNSQAGGSRRDPLYLFAGLAELAWTLRVADPVIDNPPISWPWWGMVTIVALTAWICSIILFCVEVAHWRDLAFARWLRRWLLLLTAASVPTAFAAMVVGLPLVLTLQYAALALTAMGFLAIFLARTRAASLQHKVLAAVVLLNIAVGVRDLAVFRLTESYGGNTWLRYSSLLFGLTLGAIVLARLRDATRQARDLLAHMEARVARKQAELEQIFPRMAQLALENERTAERGRILRDMHDGVGSHISTAIRQLQSGKASHDDILHTLRDSLDHLKLSIDAMHIPPGDVGALLANIRYRLESRILACGIELHWDVEELEPLTRLDSSAMRQLQFMLYEAFSNVLQHAQATMLRVAAYPIEPAGQGLQLQIIDNGTGYDTQAPQRNGLRSMHQRALAIGVALRLASSPGRSVVEITVS